MHMSICSVLSSDGKESVGFVLDKWFRISALVFSLWDGEECLNKVCFCLSGFCYDFMKAWGSVCEEFTAVFMDILLENKFCV